MARSLNKAQLIGNLGNDPEVRVTGNGTKVAQFSVATSRQWTDRNGQQQEKTEWHRIVVWGINSEKDGLAGVAERFLKKGMRVYIEGPIEYDSYENKEGHTVYTTQIRAADLIMLSGGPGEGENGGAPRAQQARSNGNSSKPAARKPAPEPAAVAAGEDDDLPF